MRSGETLIKLAKHKVDSVQKLIAAAEKIYADLDKKLCDLDLQREKERVAATNDPSLAPNFTAYVKSWTVQRGNVESSMGGVQEQIKALSLDLQEAFEEQKKFETLEERRKGRELESRKKRENAQMDEFAITRSSRR